jgi:hypothetical protein
VLRELIAAADSVALLAYIDTLSPRETARAVAP